MNYPGLIAKWGVGIAVAAFAFALGGCGVAEEPSAAGLDGPVMRHIEEFSGGGEDAEIRGVLVIEGECLYLAFDEVGERYPIVWPASTVWDADAGRVQLPNGETVGPGDSVYGGGGYHSVGDVEALAGSAAAARARECVDNQYGEIAIVNNNADGIGAGIGEVVDDDPAGEVEDSLGVEGEWLVNELIVDAARVKLDPDWPITVSVQGDEVSGTAACNGYSGVIDWSAEAGYGRFVVSDLSWTEMGCAPEVMEVEQLFLTALQAVDSYEEADGLYVGGTRLPGGFHLVRP